MQLLQGKIWKDVTTQIDTADRPAIIAAIAYVTSFDHLQFADGDTLLCDASEDSIKARRTSAATLKRLHKAGVSLFSIPNLHAKMLVCGEQTVIGSANLSNNSAFRLEDCAVLSKDAKLAGMARDYLIRLRVRRAPLTTADLKRLVQIPLDPPTRGQRKTRQSEPLARVWLVRTTREDKAQNRPTEREEIDKAKTRLGKDASWIRFTGNGRFRTMAQPGDWVIEASGDSEQMGRLTVYEPARIDERLDAERWTRFFFSKRRDEWKSLSQLRKMMDSVATKTETRWFNFALTDEALQQLPDDWSVKRAILKNASGI